jgi:hypothetical protein
MALSNHCSPGIYVFIEVFQKQVCFHFLTVKNRLEKYLFNECARKDVFVIHFVFS